MIKISDQRWNKLRLACAEPSAIPDALKDWFAKRVGTRAGISARIAEQQKRMYGKSVSLTQKEVADYPYTAADEKRINYYLGTLTENKISLNKNTPAFDPDRKPYKLMMTDYEFIRQAAVSRRIKDGDTLPLLNLFNLLPDAYKRKPFLYRPGDGALHNNPNIRVLFKGAIAKARRCDDPSITLLKINPVRHWKDIRSIPSRDIEYRGKKDMAVWRGASTGNRKASGRRTDLVEMFFDQQDRFDVGFSKIVDEKDSRTHLVKDMKSIKELLQYKLLVCLEGNDVATGLKWMLNSNSVVMMPRPSVCGWLMEDTLKPFVHYIPLADDFSDAEKQFGWAVNHEAACIEISKNASRYMSQFLDPRRETLIECEVFRHYLDNIVFY